MSRSVLSAFWYSNSLTVGNSMKSWDPEITYCNLEVTNISIEIP